MSTAVLVSHFLRESVDPLQEVSVDLLRRLQLDPVPGVVFFDRQVGANLLHRRNKQPGGAHKILLAGAVQHRFGDGLIRCWYTCKQSDPAEI